MLIVWRRRAGFHYLRENMHLLVRDARPPLPSSAQGTAGVNLGLLSLC